MENKHHLFLLVLLITILVLVSSVYFSHLEYILHGLLNNIAGGTSSSRLYGLYAYIIVMSMVAIGITDELNLSQLETHEPTISRIFWSALYFLGITGISTFLYLSIKYQLDPFRRVLYSHNGLGETLFDVQHIHTIKAGATIPLYLVGIRTWYGQGTGLTFTDLIPIGVYLVSFVVVLTTIATSLLLGVIYTRKSQYSMWAYLSYIILSFVVIKAVLDGGILWYEFVYGGMFLFLFIQRLKTKLIRRTEYTVGILLVLYAIGYTLHPLYKSPEDVLAGWVALIILLGVYKIADERKLARIIGGSLIVSGLILGRNNTFFSAYFDSLQRVPSDTVMEIVTTKLLNLPLIASEGRWRTYRYVTDHATSVQKVTIALGLTLKYHSVSAVGVNCPDESHTSHQRYIMVLEERPDPDHKLSPYFEKLTVLDEAGDTQTKYPFYKVVYQVKPCRTQTDELLINALNKLGYTRFFLF